MYHPLRKSGMRNPGLPSVLPRIAGIRENKKYSGSKAGYALEYIEKGIAKCRLPIIYGCKGIADCGRRREKEIYGTVQD